MSTLGTHLSPETRAKIRAQALGRHHSPETRAKISAASARRRHSLETRAKISAANKRRPPPSPETRAKISAAAKSKIWSLESREKVRINKTGKIYSPEQRANMSAARKGIVFSPEHRARLSEKAKNRIFSPEHRATFFSARARLVFPFKDTKPEVTVQTLLQDCGVEFTKHRHIPGLRHQWDIMIEPKKVLIEVDGCYWHGCPVCKLEKQHNKPSDTIQTAYATAAGWTVIRIRECEIKAGDFSKLKMLLIEGEHK